MKEMIALLDPYTNIMETDPTVQEQLAKILELRAADPQQRAMLEAYLSEIEFPEGARVLEVGCGTGAVTRQLAGRPGVAEVVGVDPSPVFVAKAREIATGVPNVSFEESDGRSLAFHDGSFDVIVFHTTLCHVPEPERALGEAFRVLHPGGWLAVFDGDCTTATVGTRDFDPLQTCADAWAVMCHHDPMLVRRLSALVQSAGFDVVCTRSYSYVETSEPGYMLTVINRGADALVASGRIGVDLAAAFKTEARRRAETGTFFGHIAYASLIARRPAEEPKSVSETMREKEKGK